ncbi:tetratricopeptide repeat protein [Nocardia blacklockiae]|uniref:tetratricopeptide repeat protein n=1 Tax=Nocardia blacklockiae TaxID=480036 RepID=UPI001893DD62|nr:sel1 repeat family protein [Nocardia blacklockiae]MBF6171307.1 sel1 repeat family protein [Nocardia blacklockiae]
MFGRRKRSRQQPLPYTGGSTGGFTYSVMPTETAARQAAATGDPVEMNRLGTMLKVKGQKDEAAEWFRKAAEAGNTDAMANLAMHLINTDKRAAAEWFRRAGGPLGEAMAERLLKDADDDSRR